MSPAMACVLAMILRELFPARNSFRTLASALCSSMFFSSLFLHIGTSLSSFLRLGFGVPIQTLVINKDLWGKQNGSKYRRRMRKRINKTWASIYNYYKLKERQKKRRQERLSKSDGKKKKPPPKVFKRTESLAMPKKEFLPETKGQKKKKIFSDYKHLEVMAAPVSRPEPKPKRVGVNPAALTCTPSEITMRLAQVPERWLRVPKPLMPGKVKRGALKYKITPKIEALAVPKPRSEKAKTEDDAGPWTISKSALKYKATPRIIELAKPIERD
ncbi:hypothetical protein NQ318_009655 [Aromia moschata]|uniref:Uncharacterized protein n=1 Tax=Aromia moschata TaxID=1265417 RepID=A0AAV8XZX1_9CUCU|nr:hypothetical protein NQ318_009655 [Aromia moschata]